MPTYPYRLWGGRGESQGNQTGGRRMPPFEKEFSLKALYWLSKTIVLQFWTWGKFSNVYSVKMEGKKFKLRTEMCLNWRLSLSWFLRQTRWAHRLSSQHLTAIPTPNIAGLVPSVVFCPQPWFFATVRTHFHGKNTRVYRKSVTLVTRLTRVTLNQLEVHIAWIRSFWPQSGLFSPQSWFLRRSEHIFPRKTAVFISIESLLSPEKI